MKDNIDQLLEDMLAMERKEDNPQSAVNVEKVAPPFGSTLNLQPGVTMQFPNLAFLLGILHHKLKVLLKLIRYESRYLT